jgi:hypothetical protein
VPDRIRAYGEFWPYYLREHRRRATRVLHYFGTLLGLALLAGALLSGDWRLLPAALIAGYLFAWLGHILVEKNRPATFTYPVWSLASDFRKLGLWLAGRLESELERAGIEP